MTALTLVILLGAIVSLSAVAIGLFSIWQTRAVAGSIEKRIEAVGEDCDECIRSLEGRVAALTAQIGELERQPAVTLTPGMPKPGMNVVKRTQALRLHRRGEQPAEIASALDLPRQEVDLLLKVHSIVISNI
jgi:hypothetical protein